MGYLNNMLNGGNVFMDVDEIIKKMKYSLEEKTPTLVLGAGFSVGTKNGKKQDVPIGKKLGELLYSYTFIKNKPTKEILDEDESEAKKYSEEGKLKELCSLLRAEGRVELRNDFLTDIFLGVTSQKDYHTYLTEYKWDRIFTLNIDDLVENLYKEQNINLNIWNHGNMNRKNIGGNTTLIKLHGCVNNRREGYIFDKQEYTEFLGIENCYLREFADSYVGSDVIFLGTEFQEEDLWTIISKYSSAKYDTDGNNYYFVSPKINDAVLKRWMTSKNNVFWIKWDTKEFLEFLHNDVVHNKEIQDVLTQKGVLFLDKVQNNLKKNYVSELYMGKEVIYDDIFEKWDIVHPGIDKLEEKIEKMAKNIVVSIVGKSYVGKSVCAKRVIVDLKMKGYIACQFNDMRSSENMQLLLQYMKQLPENSKVAILFENASFYYALIYKNMFLSDIPNVDKIVIITTETINNHINKRDILLAKKCLLEFKIDETISWAFAKNIYMKLKEKHRFGRLFEYVKNESEIEKYAYQVDDIIEFLYNMSHGRGFEDYYYDMFLKEKDVINSKYMQAICMLEVLGFSSIPVRILPYLLITYKNSFNFKEFQRRYEEIIIIENNRIRIRCLRLIQKVVTSELTQKDKKDILRQVVQQTTGQFKEGETNEWSEIFQRALSVKRILAEKILELDTICDLLDSIEKEGECYSYYWIQRGLAIQKKKAYELADNYFREAIRIWDKSYQARHALAKNLMERGINEYKEEKISYASYYMAEGKDEMKKIMEDVAYSRGYRYSLHAYIDMVIKYHSVTNTVMSEEDACYIEEKIINMPSLELDSYICDIIDLFIEYCKEKGLEKSVERIMYKKWADLVKIKATLEQYMVENLDLE